MSEPEKPLVKIEPSCQSGYEPQMVDGRVVFKMPPPQETMVMRLMRRIAEMRSEVHRLTVELALYHRGADWPEGPAAAMSKLQRMIFKARCRIVMSGGKVEELWLGPEERVVLENLVGEMWLAGTMRGPSDFSPPQLVDGASVFGGMIVRFMESPGIRVGYSAEVKPLP